MNIIKENFNSCPVKVQSRANCGDSATDMFYMSEECNSPYVKRCRDYAAGEAAPVNLGRPSPADCAKSSVACDTLSIEGGADSECQQQPKCYVDKKKNICNDTPKPKGCDANSPDDETSSAIRTGLNDIYMKANKKNRNGLCEMLGLPNSKETKDSYTEDYPLFTNYISGENYGCNEQNIDLVRKRCLTQNIPLENCDVDKLQELWTLCKKYNKEDTVNWDQNICPSRVNPEYDYYTDWATNLYRKTPEEREEEFIKMDPDTDYKDNGERKAWISTYNIKRLPKLKQVIDQVDELSKDPLYKEGKYIPEIKAMQRCILRDYLAPKSCTDNNKVLDKARELAKVGEITDLELVELEKVYSECSDDVEHEGRMVNRFCDWGNSRSSDFYNDSENYSGNKNSSEYIKKMLNNHLGEKILKNDDDIFTAYSGIFYDDSIRLLNEKVENKKNPYLEMKNEVKRDCGDSQDQTKCLLEQKMHPDPKSDYELGEDSECVTDVILDSSGVLNDYTEGKCDSTYYEKSSSNSDEGCKKCGQRKFYKSLNCKYRNNPNNIYGHGCEDPYAACVKLATPNELKELERDYMEGSNSNLVVATNLTYPELKPHNFLTQNMIRDRENLWSSMIGYSGGLENKNKLTPKEKEVYEKEGIYKCMRCGLRGTVPDKIGVEQGNIKNELYDRKGAIVSSKDPHFLIFTTTIGENNEILETNCNENDIAWYEYEKEGILKRLDQDRSLRNLDREYNALTKQIELSEENIIKKMASYEKSRTTRKERLKSVRAKYKKLIPELENFILMAENKVKKDNAARLENKKDTGHLKKILYVIGFIIFLILILFLLF